MADVLLHTRQVAERLQVSEQTARRLMMTGRIPAFRTGYGPHGHWRVAPADLETWIAAQMIAQQVRAQRVQRVSPAQ